MTRVILSTAFAAFVAAAAFSTASAQPPAPRDQTMPDLSYSTDRDQYVLVWVEDHGAGNRIMARRVRANGLPVGGPDGEGWELTGATGSGAMTGQKGDQRQPAVENGIVVWSEMAPGATDYDLYAQKLQTNFRAYGPPTMIAGGPGNQAHPDLVANGANGEWLVVWSEDATDGGDVMGVRLSPALTQRSTVIEVAKGAGIAEDPTIARDLTDVDSFLVVFTDDRNGNKDLFGTRVTESGLPRGGSLGGIFEVVVTPEDDHSAKLVVNRVQSSRPLARSNGSTRNLLLWTHDNVTDGPDVMAYRLGNNGIPVGGSFMVAGGPGIQSAPAGDLRGVTGEREEFLIAWQADATGSLDIVGRDLGLNGLSRRVPWPLASD